MSLLRQSANTLASKMAITLINIPVSMIIARTLGAAGQGIYTSAILYPGLLGGFGLLGLDAAQTYYLSRDRRSLGPLLANSVVVVLVLTVILMPSYVLLFRPIAGDKGAALRPYLYLSSLVVPLILCRHLFLATFLGLGKVERYNSWMVVSQLVLLALIIVGLRVMHRHARFAVASFAVSTFVFLVAGAFWVRRQMTPEDRTAFRFSWATLRRSLIYGLKGHAGSVLTQFTNRFDAVLVLPWLGAAALGYYSISAALAEKLTLLTASVQFVLFPRIASSNREEADRITPLVCRNVFVWMAAGAVVMYFLGNLLIRIFYSNRFLPALGAFHVLLPGVVALTISGLLYSDFSGRNRRVLPTVAMAVAYAVNLGLDFLWIRPYGIRGAAWASTIAYVVQSLLMALFFWRLTGIQPLRLLVPERGDFAMYRKAAGKLIPRLAER